jgi:two-component system, cell cycle sensor histidine kinase and response regulator CckA
MLEISVEALMTWAKGLRTINDLGSRSDFLNGLAATAAVLTGARRSILATIDDGHPAHVAHAFQSPAVTPWSRAELSEFMARANGPDAASVTPSFLHAPLAGVGGAVLGELLVFDKPDGFSPINAAALEFVAALASSIVVSRQSAQDAKDISSELTVERRRLESLLDTVPGGIALTDIDGNYLFVNDGAAPLLALSAGDALSTPAADPSSAALWRDGTPREPHDLPLVRAARGEVVRQDVIGLIEPDRSVRWLLVNATPSHGDDGQIAGAVAAFQDITELVELQRRAEASEARLKASQRVAGVGSWERDYRTGELFWSDETYRLYGLDGSTPITFDAAFAMIVPEDRDKVLQAAATTIRTGGPFFVRHRVVRADGHVRMLSNRGESVVNSAGRTVRILGTVHDVTDEEAEQDRLQRAQQIESMGRLAGGLAHDLNNLLTVIGGHAGLLAIGADERALESTRAIVKAVERAASLMRQLLAVGRREVLQPTSIDVNGLLESEKINFRRVLPPGVIFQYALADDLPAGYFDQAKLEQVVLNMILNARDAVAGEGTVRVETSVRVLDAEYAASRVEVQPGQYVCITISDDGCGMTPEVLARALEPFYSTKPREQGTGLGLSTSAGVLSQSGGHLTLTSEENRGSAVNIYIPVSDVAEIPPAESKVLQRIVGRGTVLVAEDDDQVRELVVAALEASGYRVIATIDGTDAARAASEHDGVIDLLITDVSMPGSGGHELAKTVAASRPGVEVLYVSGYTENSVVLHGIVSHDINFLAKPFAVKDLLAAVHNLIDAD